MSIAKIMIPFGGAVLGLVAADAIRKPGTSGADAKGIGLIGAGLLLGVALASQVKDESDIEEKKP